MGKPLDPTPAQAEQLNRETALPAPEEMKLQGGKLELTLTPNTLALVKISGQ
jgi:xylan 1,4-beta-xylosidase